MGGGEGVGQNMTVDDNYSISHYAVTSAVPTYPLLRYASWEFPHVKNNVATYHPHSMTMK